MVPPKQTMLDVHIGEDPDDDLAFPWQPLVILAALASGSAGFTWALSGPSGDFWFVVLLATALMALVFAAAAKAHLLK
jgi:hypothetical protein